MFRRAALASGYTDTQLKRAVQAGDLVRLWNGAYLNKDGVERTPKQVHKLTTIAAVSTGDGDHVVSHESAALFHGLSILHPRLNHIHFATGRATGGGIDHQRHLHSGKLDDSDIVVVDGIRVTSIDRTAADLACTSDFAVALAVLDSALRHNADPDAISELLGRRKRGATQGRRALAHADGKSENAGESWGRAQMICDGLPVPRLQHEFYSDSGIVVARTDYDWDGKLVGEFDGLRKYEKDLREGETAADAVIREKRREDDLRRMDVMVIRWLWENLRQQSVVPMVREWLGRVGIAA